MSNYELREAGVLAERSRGNAHMEECLSRAMKARNDTGCHRCPFKDGPIQLAYQYSATGFGPSGLRREGEKPANIVAVVPCKQGGSPQLVQVMGGPNPKHCARARVSNVAA